MFKLIYLFENDPKASGTHWILHLLAWSVYRTYLIGGSIPSSASKLNRWSFQGQPPVLNTTISPLGSTCSKYRKRISYNYSSIIFGDLIYELCMYKSHWAFTFWLTTWMALYNMCYSISSFNWNPLISKYTDRRYSK